MKTLILLLSILCTAAFGADVSIFNQTRTNVTDGSLIVPLATSNKGYGASLSTINSNLFNQGFFVAGNSNVPGVTFTKSIYSFTSETLATNASFTMTFSGTPANGQRWEVTVQNTGTTNIVWTFPLSQYMGNRLTNPISSQVILPNNLCKIQWQYYTTLGSPTNNVINYISSSLETIADLPYTAATNLIVDCSIPVREWRALLTNANSFVSFINPPSYGQAFYMLISFKQDATGNRVVRWTNTVLWPSGTAPTITVTAGALDDISLKADAFTVGTFHAIVPGQNFQ